MVEGLKEAVEIIDKELEYAKRVNIQIALGMLQAKALIELRIREIKNEQ